MLESLLRFLCRCLFRLDVRGPVMPPHPGKLLVIANHASMLDGLLLSLFLPFRATLVVHTSVVNKPFYRWLLSFAPHLAVDPGNPMAMRKVIHLLEAGQPVVIFPEGRITVTGSLMKIYEGPAFVAARTAAPILPVRIEGTAHSWFSHLSAPHPRRLFPKITLSMLPVTTLPLPAAATDRMHRHHTGEAMRRLMQDMLFVTHPANTLFSALLDSIELHGRRTRVLEDIKRSEESYGTLLKKSLALGRLTAKVSREGETIGVLMPNVSTTIALIFGLSALRRVPAMLNYTAGTAGLQNACRVANIKTVLTSRQFLEAARLGEVAGALQGVQLICLEDLRPHFGWLDKLWLIGFALCLPRRAARPAQPDEAAVVLFTSGSEGQPKGVVHSHRSILANVAQIRAIIDFSPADKFMMALPLFHSFGFTCGAIMPLVSGTKIFLYPSPLHYRTIPEIVYDSDCSVLFGTSTFLANYARFAHPYDFYKLRHVVAGAEKLSEEVRQTWMEKFGLRILEGYGTTECAPVVAVNTPMAYRSGSVGTLLPGMQARLQRVPGIEPGALLSVRGPNVMLGYYLFEQPGVLQAPLGGWYDTGDIVDIDADGFITIHGRVKRFAKIAGEMISLESVERIARRASPLLAHAVTTRADVQRGECIILFTTDAALKRDALLAAARSLGAPELAIPRQTVVLRELPVLGSGKTDYVLLQRMACELDKGMVL